MARTARPAHGEPPPISTICHIPPDRLTAGTALVNYGTNRRDLLLMGCGYRARRRRVAGPLKIPSLRRVLVGGRDQPRYWGVPRLPLHWSVDLLVAVGMLQSSGFDAWIAGPATGFRSLDQGQRVELETTEGPRAPGGQGRRNLAPPASGQEAAVRPALLC
jgi:hypothetical protein